MIIPKFKDFLECIIIPNIGVVFVSERSTNFLPSKLYAEVCQMINGVNLVEQIVDKLSTNFRFEEIYFILSELEIKGYIQEADNFFNPESIFNKQINNFLNCNFQSITEVDLINLTTIKNNIFNELLDNLSIKNKKNSDYFLVLTDNYLDARLNAINNEMIALHKKWLLCKPTGSIIWIGPLFNGKHSVCWNCLKERLSGHSNALSFLHKNCYTDKQKLPIYYNNVSLNLALSITAFNLSTNAATASSSHDLEEVTMMSYDLLTHKSQTHILPKIDSCKICSKEKSDQITITPKKSAKEYDYLSDSEFFLSLEKFISPITGIVSELKKEDIFSEGLFYLYSASHPFLYKEGNAESFFKNSCIKSGGKGKTETKAKIGAVCEAIERYSGIFRGNEDTIEASFIELGDRAIHPNEFLLISENQYKNRIQLNEYYGVYHNVPLVFPLDKKFTWSPIKSVNSEKVKYLPTAFCYYGTKNQYERDYIHGDSNGAAAGTTLEEAIVSGFLELFERDAVAIWWYNRLQMPGVDLSTINSEFIQGIILYLSSLNRNIWLLNITNDLGVPVFVALSKRIDAEREDIIYGFGSHFDPLIAIEKAILELLQTLPCVFYKNNDDTTKYLYVTSDCKRWWDEANVSNQLYLLPNSNINASNQFDIHASENVLNHCLNIVKKAGFEAYYINQTRGDIKIPVVKVMVPGLRHFWRRFAPGRLFDVPVKMGLLDLPNLENNLNPHPIFF